MKNNSSGVGGSGGESDRLPFPLSSRIDVDLFALSHQGHVREQNEDHYLVIRTGRYLETVFSNVSENRAGYRFEEAAYGMIVADGVGGERSGEVASREAIINLLELALRTPDWQFGWGPKERNTVMWRMQDRLHRVDAALLQQADANAALDGMSTTLTAALTHGKDLVIGHVGDSRAYLCRQGKLEKLTRDHTLAEHLLDGGEDIEKDNLLRELGHVLLQALGGSHRDLRPDINHFTLEDNDRLLICTDGLTKMVDDLLITSILASAKSAQSACRELVELALGAGVSDNVTVVVAHYSIPEEFRGEDERS
jgi:serine/threonine protein phosphatase PrpC